MVTPLVRLREMKAARQRIAELVRDRSAVRIVHYSCESFYDKAESKSPRVVSIAVRNSETGQTKSFAVQLLAEERGLKDSDIWARYEDLEREMLSQFFAYAKEQGPCTWVHWNMRDVNFGFEALDHRAKVLAVEAYHVPDAQRHDLARLLFRSYGPAYASHPRLFTLLGKNNIRPLDFLTGAQEAEAFVDGKFHTLHMSTLRKVDVIEDVLKRAANGSLRTEAGFRDRYGLSLSAFAELVVAHPYIILLFGGASIGGAVIAFSQL